MPDLLAKRCNKDLAVLLPLRHRKNHQRISKKGVDSHVFTLYGI